MTGLLTHSPRLTLTLGANRILFGALSPDELQIPFTAEPGLYTELQGGSQNHEMGYFDIRGFSQDYEGVRACERATVMDI